MASIETSAPESSSPVLGKNEEVLNYVDSEQRFDGFIVLMDEDIVIKERKYFLEEVLSRTTNTCVYKAVRRDDKAVFAIKVMDIFTIITEPDESRIPKEVKANRLASVDNEGVTKVLDWEIIEVDSAVKRGLYTVMEYFENTVDLWTFRCYKLLEKAETEIITREAIKINVACRRNGVIPVLEKSNFWINRFTYELRLNNFDSATIVDASDPVKENFDEAAISRELGAMILRLVTRQGLAKDTDAGEGESINGERNYSADFHTLFQDCTESSVNKPTLHPCLM